MIKFRDKRLVSLCRLCGIDWQTWSAQTIDTEIPPIERARHVPAKLTKKEAKIAHQISWQTITGY